MPTSELETSLYNATALWKRYDADMNAEEVVRGYCEPENWVLYLEDGITVTRMTRQSDPAGWEMGAGNFIFWVHGERFALLGISQVHDQLYITVPPTDSEEWHVACNRLLEDNNIPYRVLHPANATFGYKHDYKTDDGGVLKIQRTTTTTNLETWDAEDIVVGTTFMAKIHGGPWTRCKPNSDEDYHLLYGFGVIR